MKIIAQTVLFARRTAVGLSALLTFARISPSAPASNSFRLRVRKSLSLCFLLILIFAPGIVLAQPVFKSAVITGPDCVGDSSSFTLTMMGTGSGRVYITIFDQDPIDDDELYNEQPFDISSDDNGNFTETYTFTLNCVNGTIFGNGVSTGESEAEIGAVIEGFFGGDFITSPIITVKCCPEPGAVAFGILAGGGLLGLIAHKRRT